MRFLACLMAFALAGCVTTDDVAAPSGADLTDADLSDAEPTISWGGLDAPVRPGSSLGGYCTFNFLFTGMAPDGSGPHGFIGTAAHCTELDQRVEQPAVGEIGTVVYDSDETEGADPALDFSLILLDEGAIPEANPTMLGWDGPTGSVTASDLAVGDMVYQHGYGMVLGENPYSRSRAGFLTDYTDTMYNIDMPAVWGDSGSPILHESGKALGIVSHFGLGAMPPSTDEGPLMPWIFQELEAAGWAVELALA